MRKVRGAKTEKKDYGIKKKKRQENRPKLPK